YRTNKTEADRPEIRLSFSRVYLQMALLQDAEHALTTAASLKPDNPSYQYTLAAAKVGKRQFEAAQTLLEGLLRSRPGDAQLQYALGSVLYLEGHPADAAAHLRETVRVQSD